MRAALVGGSVAVAVVLLSRGLARLASGTDDVPGLVRGVRLVFLAVAALAAAAGWLLGEALPLLVALVIAGIDVVETSFLLLVVGQRRASTEGADQLPFLAILASLDRGRRHAQAAARDQHRARRVEQDVPGHAAEDQAAQTGLSRASRRR